MTFDLNKHIHRLLQSEPFFAALSRQVDKRADESIPTAGVKVDDLDNRYVMYYNPGYMEQLTDEQKTGVLKHEFYHLIFRHVTHRMPEGGMSKLWNFATDLAINGFIVDELPEGALIPGRGKFEEYRPFESAEWYFKRLQESEDFNGDGEGQPQEFDTHDWEEGEGVAKEIADQRLKGMVKKAAEECAKGSSWGSITSDIRKEILKSFETVIDWKKVLSYFIKTSQIANKKSSLKKINKRYAYIHPGRKVSRQAKIAISIDQSGSVSDSMLESFFGELNKLAKFAEFTVIPFDSVINEKLIYTWKKGENKKTTRVLAGGTDFDPPTEYVNKNNFDGHIILTDLMAPKPKRSRCQRMWMTTRYYAARPYFKTNEKIIAIDEK